MPDIEEVGRRLLAKEFLLAKSYKDEVMSLKSQSRPQ